MVVSDWAGWETREFFPTEPLIVPHVDMDGLREAVETAIRDSVTGQKVIKPVLNWIAGRSGKSVPTILSKTRNQHVVQARQFAAWVLLATTDLPLLRIGHVFNRDHTTIIHARRVVPERIQKGVYPDEWLTDCAKWIKPYSPYYPIIKPWVAS